MCCLLYIARACCHGQSCHVLVVARRVSGIILSAACMMGTGAPETPWATAAAAVGPGGGLEFRYKTSYLIYNINYLLYNVRYLIYRYSYQHY